MPQSPVDSTALLTGAAVSAVALLLYESQGFYWAGVLGLVAALVLFSYDREGYRSVFQSVAFSGVTGACLALPSLETLRLTGLLAISGLGLVVLWVVLTAIVCAVDRARMAGRVPNPVPYNAAPGIVTAPSFAPRPAASPIYTPTESVASVPPPPVSPPEIPIPPEPAPTEAEPATAAAPPQAIPARRGKEVTIFVTLLGEGLNVLRSIRAEHMGRDFYLIIDEMPSNETWQFIPGQIVRCEKRKLSSGKALVAVEEAPRAS